MSEATKKRLLDPAFKYTKEADSDIRKTFARLKREQARQAKPTPANVTALPRKAKP